MYVSNEVGERMRLLYHIIGDGLSLIMIRDLGEENRIMLLDSMWGMKFLYYNTSAHYAPNLAN